MSDGSSSSSVPSATDGAQDKSPVAMPLARPMERLDIREIKAWMFDNEIRRSEIGVSPQWLARFAGEYLISIQELAELMDVRKSFKGSFTSMRHLLDQGFEPSEVHTLYGVRHQLEEGVSEGDWIPSLTQIGHFAQLFGLSVSDDLADEIATAHDVIGGRSVADSLYRLCKFAKREHITVLSDALELFNTSLTVRRS